MVQGPFGSFWELLGVWPDYEETFASVAKMNIVKTIMEIAASRRWSLRQLDVKSTFLHDE